MRPPQNSPKIPASRRPSFGFTVVELIVLIALLGVLLTLAVVAVGDKPVVIKNVKLEADVATLNQLIAVYVTDGGNLAGLTSPQAVLDRMKRSRPQGEWQRHTGPTSGKLVDVRLRARMSTAASDSGLTRARWNSRTLKFEIITGGGSAVSEFYLDNTLASTDFGTDARATPNVKFETASRGWVWAATASPSFSYATPGTSTGGGVDNPFDPSDTVPVPPTPPVDPGDGGGGDDGGGDGGGGGGGSTAPSPTKLPTPSISPGGGTFAYAAFPTSITINRNGANPSRSQLQYRINGGAWTDAGNGNPTLTVESGNLLQVRNASLDTATYYDSNIAGATYYRLTDGFSGSLTGTWGNATGGGNLVTSLLNGAATSTFKHGNTKLDLGLGQFLDAGLENVLTFEKAPFTDIKPNAWFSLGNLTMLNGTTFYSSEADGVTLSLNLSMSEPAQTGVVHVNFGLISTENSSDRLASADIVELRNPNTDFRVTVDGIQYRLELSWVTLDPGAGVVQGNQFLIFEGSSARAELRARLVSNR